MNNHCYPDPFVRCGGGCASFVRGRHFGVEWLVGNEVFGWGVSLPGQGVLSEGEGVVCQWWVFTCRWRHCKWCRDWPRVSHGVFLQLIRVLSGSGGSFAGEGGWETHLEIFLGVVWTLSLNPLWYLCYRGIYYGIYTIAGILHTGVVRSSVDSRLTCAWQYFGTLIFELFF